MIYISHVSFAENIVDSLNDFLTEDNTMILFYDAIRPAINGSILDYIAEGKIQLKKLPRELKESYALVAFELGRLLCKNPDEEYILLGSSPFPEFYTILIQYDKKIMNKIRTTNPNKGSDREQGGGAKGNTKTCKPKPVKQNQGTKGAERHSKAGGKQARQAHPPSEQQETDGQALLPSQTPGKKKEHSDARQVLPTSQAYESMEKTISGDDAPEEHNDDLTPSSDTKMNESGQGKRVDEQKKENQDKEVIDQTLDAFLKLVEDICKEPVPDTDLAILMMALSSAKGATSEETAQQLFESSLRIYFTKSKRAYYYMTKLRNDFHRLWEFIDDF